MRIKRIGSKVGNKIAGAAIWMLGFGVILGIWGGVWLVYLLRNSHDKDLLFYIATGLLLSGIDLFIIGMLSGRIGRAAREPANESEPEAERVAIATPEPRD